MKNKFILILVLSSVVFAKISLSTSSPSALKKLTAKQKIVNPTHEEQRITLVVHKELLKAQLLERENHIFEINKHLEMLFNFFIIKNEKG